MPDSPRVRRMAGRVRQIVAGYIESQIKDPRLGMVTVTDVRMTGDLHDATVYYTVYGDDEIRVESGLALEAARGQMRTEVGRQTGVKFTPTLSFVLDDLGQEAQRMELLLAKAREADAELAKVREGAQHAGDPDPYRPEVIGEPADTSAQPSSLDDKHPVISRPDINHYDIKQPDVRHPDVSHPDVSHPDVSHPDVSHPDVSHPDVSHPDVSHPDVSHPDVSHPDVSHPDVSHPDVSSR